MPMHFPELIVILVVALLVFGPKKLPEMGASIGKSIQQFKKGMSELTDAPETRGWSPEDAALEAKRLELDLLEREIALKRAQAATYETPEAIIVEASMPETATEHEVTFEHEETSTQEHTTSEHVVEPVHTESYIAPEHSAEPHHVDTTVAAHVE